MKVKLYMDLPNDYITDEKSVMASGEDVLVSQKMDNYTRYLIEVDMPIHHFRAVADRKIEGILIGKEEE